MLYILITERIKQHFINPYLGDRKMITIIIAVVVVGLAAVFLCIAGAEDFPSYYNPQCFDCNRGECVGCPYVDPDYRDPEGMWKPQTEEIHIDAHGKRTEIW